MRSASIPSCTSARLAAPINYTETVKTVQSLCTRVVARGNDCKTSSACVRARRALEGFLCNLYFMEPFANSLNVTVFISVRQIVFDPRLKPKKSQCLEFLI